MDFTALDKLIADEPRKAYEQLKELINKDEKSKSDLELLWRMTKTCFKLSNEYEKKDPKRKQFIHEGLEYGRLAHSLDSQCFEALRWLAILQGISTDFMNVKEKAEQGKVFKELLDKALEMNPKEFTICHLRGRYIFEISQLSWIEKKVCNAIFTELPDANIDLALKDFIEAERNVTFDWAENWLYMARCYAQKKDKANAEKYVAKVEAMKNEDSDMVRESLKEIKDLIAKCK